MSRLTHRPRLSVDLMETRFLTASVGSSLMATPVVLGAAITFAQRAWNHTEPTDSGSDAHSDSYAESSNHIDHCHPDRLIAQPRKRRG